MKKFIGAVWCAAGLMGLAGVSAYAQYNSGNWPTGSPCVGSTLFFGTDSKVYACGPGLSWWALTRTGDPATTPTHASRHLPNGNDAIEKVARVTAGNVTTTLQTSQAIAPLAVSIENGATYLVEAVIFGQSSSAAGNKYGLGFVSGPSTVSGGVSCSTSATATLTEQFVGGAMSASCLTVANAQGMIRISGSVKALANAGTIQLYHSKTTSGTSTVFVGSYMRAIRVE